MMLKLFKLKYILTVIFIFIIIKFKLYKKAEKNESKDKRTNVIIWWTKISGDSDHKRQCGNVECFFTENRSYVGSQNLRGFLFYGSQMNTSNFPLPRTQNHLWGLLHEESPKNVPFLLYEETLNLFNFTSTFSRYSDVPLTFQFLKSLQELSSVAFLLSVEEKNQLQRGDRENLAPVLYIQSICDTMSNRDEYVKELGKYIRIDSYGACLNNKTMPESLAKDYITKIDSEEYYKFIARYKFVIAYENGICDDYITEKLWRPLIIGTVPIYFGSPKIMDWLPDTKSAILIKDFRHPKELAKFILNLNKNDIEYNNYFKHKIISTISNKNFLNEFKIKKKILQQYNNEMVEEFECFMCQKFTKINLEMNHHANHEHYKCYLNTKIINKIINLNNDGNAHHILRDDSLRTAKCEARIIRDFVGIRNTKYTDRAFRQELMSRYQKGEC